MDRYTLLALVVFLEQAGLPIPAVPALLAIGALGGAGHFRILPAFLLASVAAMAGDLIWYAAGRARGRSVLSFLCRVSIEPDSCVRTTENAYARVGACALLFAKFVPGLNTAAPPLAGLTGMSLSQFILCDGLGTVIWVGSFLTLGYLFREQIDPVLDWLNRSGVWLGAVIAIVAGLYIAFKLIQRHRFIRSLRVRRITPEDLWRKMEAGEKPVVVDLRGQVHTGASRLPGALTFSVADLQARHREIPRDRDIILYCS